MDDSPPKSIKVRPATLDDAAALAELVNDCSIERTGVPLVTTQYVGGVLRTPGVNLETDTLLAFGPQEQPVGFALVQDTAPHTSFFVLADVHPHYRGRGLGSLLCRCCKSTTRSPSGVCGRERWARSSAQRLSSDADARELLTGQGYRLVRHNYRMVVKLEEPPPQPVVPAGITLRPFVREREGRALIRALREAFHDNWSYVERPFEEEYRRWMHMLDRDPENDPSPFWFVAVDGKEMAGFCLCNPREAGDPETAWIHVVGVRPAWRRRGLALALLLYSFGILYREGRSRIALEVDTENPTGATRLYQKAGMEVERQYDFYGKEVRPGK